jgi:hypothetical protein
MWCSLSSNEESYSYGQSYYLYFHVWYLLLLKILIVQSLLYKNVLLLLEQLIVYSLINVHVVVFMLLNKGGPIWKMLKSHYSLLLKSVSVNYFNHFIIFVYLGNFPLNSKCGSTSFLLFIKKILYLLLLFLQV